MATNKQISIPYIRIEYKCNTYYIYTPPFDKIKDDWQSNNHKKKYITDQIKEFDMPKVFKLESVWPLQKAAAVKKDKNKRITLQMPSQSIPTLSQLFQQGQIAKC